MLLMVELKSFQVIVLIIVPVLLGIIARIITQVTTYLLIVCLVHHVGIKKVADLIICQENQHLCHHLNTEQVMALDITDLVINKIARAMTMTVAMMIQTTITETVAMDVMSPMTNMMTIVMHIKNDMTTLLLQNDTCQHF